MTPLADSCERTGRESALEDGDGFELDAGEGQEVVEVPGAFGTNARRRGKSTSF